METTDRKTNGPRRQEVRLTARRVAVLTLVLLAVAVIITGGLVAHSGYGRYICEREATARLRALNADFGKAAVGPPWLVRWLVRCNLPVLRSIGGINGVGPAFGDSDLALLRYSTRIGNLDLDRTGVSDEGLPHLKNLTHLYILELGQTAVTDAGLIHLQVLPELRLLKLSGTSITDAGLAQLVSIHSLNWLILDDTQVTDEGLTHLARLRGLERLDVNGTAVTPDGIARLKRTLPDIEIHGP